MREGERSEDGRFELWELVRVRCGRNHAPRRDAAHNLYFAVTASPDSRLDNAIIYTVCGVIEYFAEYFRREIVEARHLYICGMSKGAGNHGG